VSKRPNENKIRCRWREQVRSGMNVVQSGKVRLHTGQRLAALAG
jgi:hypothetical protein